MTYILPILNYYSNLNTKINLVRRRLRINNDSKKNKKYGFTLIELIIVLAVMAIIGSISIPNLVAIRENAKIKADIQSCEVVKRVITAYVADGTIEYNVNKVGTIVSGKEGVTSTTFTATEKTKIDEVLRDVKEPQSKKGVKFENGKLLEDNLNNANKYQIRVNISGDVDVTIVN